IEVLLPGEYLQYVPDGGYRDALLADPLEAAPTAGVGYDDGSGHVPADDLDMESTVEEGAAHAQLDVVAVVSLHIDGVFQPLAGLEVVHDIAAAGGVGGGDDVHVLGGPVLASGVARDVVVIGYAFTTKVKVLRFDQPRHGEWRACEGRLSAWGGKRPECLIGRHREVPYRILGLHPVVVEGAGGQAAQGLGVGGDQRGDERRGAPVGARRPVLQLGVRVLIGGPGDRGLTGGDPRRRHGGNGGRRARRHQRADHAV